MEESLADTGSVHKERVLLLTLSIWDEEWKVSGGGAPGASDGKVAVEEAEHSQQGFRDHSQVEMSMEVRGRAGQSHGGLVVAFWYTRGINMNTAISRN